MKRYISALMLCLVAMVCHAELSSEQMVLRRNIVARLTKDGYKPNIDEDGDVFFNEDGVRYWIHVNSTWSDPFMVTLFSEYAYNPDKGKSQSNVGACTSVVNQYKAVKLYCRKDAYQLRADMVCKDADTFNEAYRSILPEMGKARRYIDETVNSSLSGMDLTGNRDEIYSRAMEFYNEGKYYQAFRLFDFLAANNYPMAYGMLGQMYETGRGVPRNESRMIDNYKKAIESGQAWCAYNLGAYYYDKKNYLKAEEYLSQGASNENSKRSESYFLIGQMNENGQGMPKNLQQAIQNYRKAVEYSTELESDGRMALMRLKEQVEDPKDFTEVSRSLLNSLTPEEMYIKGYEYENGKNNREVSLAKAYGYYKAAADRNNMMANLKMGEIYISKLYPFNDKQTSDKYYAKAFKVLKKVEQESASANYYLGLMYKNGNSVEKDPDMAMTYFKTAAGKDSGPANYELGLIYQSELEKVEAFNCFLKAAEKGVAPAMLEVAKAYETGRGTSPSRESAIFWYTKCEDTNTQYSREAAKALRKMGMVDDEKE